MDNPAIALAELMNQRQARLAVEPSLGAPQQNRLASNGRSLAEEQARPRRPAGGSGLPAAATIDDDKHIEAVAALVCGLLGAKVKSLLTRKLRAWPHVLEDADDLGQLAALAFVEGYRQGKVKPDAATQQHTASSVSAYMWGICNHIFIDTLRRNRRAGEPREIAEDGMSGALQDSSPLDRILPEAPEEDDESRLWSVLATVRNRCHPQDIVMTYLMGCGFKSGEVRRLLEVSINLPAIAVRRVGQAVREILGLNSATRQEELQIEDRNHQARNGGVNPGTGGSANPAPLPTLELLKGKYFAELVQRLDSPSARNMFLREAVAALGPAEQQAAEQLLADRQSAIRADGDWSWGLLSAAQRRELLLRNAKLVRGAGIPDAGAAQQAALKELVANLGQIFKDVDQALLGDDLDWLLPLSKALNTVLVTIGEFKEMRQRYRLLLETAQRLGSQRMEMLAQLGLGIALMKLGENSEGREALERAVALARELNEPRGEASALYNLAGIAMEMCSYDRANELYGQSLSRFRAIGDRCGEALAINGLAHIQLNLSEYDSAEDLQRQALKIMREIGDRRGEGRCVSTLAGIHLNLGEYDISEGMLRQALEIEREIGDREGEAMSLLNLAVIHDCMGNHLSSAEMYGQSLVLWRQLGNRRMEAYSLHGLADLQWWQGEYQVGAENLKEVTKIQQETGNRSGEAEALKSLADLYLAKGEYARAADAYRQSLVISLAIGSRFNEVLALCGLAAVHISKKEPGAAKDICLKSLSISMEISAKASICRSCAYASACLALLGTLQPAAAAYYGAMYQATRLKVNFLKHEKEHWGKAIRCLEAAVGSGEIPDSELAQWRAEGEAMSLDELAEFVLAQLQKL